MKQRMAEAAGVPSDVILGVPVLSLEGRQELTVTNYRGILEYTESLIRIQTKVGQIKVTGSHLQVEYYTNDEMKVIGCISQLEYQ